MHGPVPENNGTVNPVMVLNRLGTSAEGSCAHNYGIEIALTS